MLSPIQQYILLICRERSGQCSRRFIDSDYKASRSRARQENYKNIITQSIERLINRGLLTGYGTKTKEKLFIDKVKLTSAGRKFLAELLKKRQTKLPLHGHRRAQTMSATPVAILHRLRFPCKSVFISV